jgi:hypothetical protein
VTLAKLYPKRAPAEEQLGAKERRGRPEKKPAIAGNFQKGETVDLAARRAGFKRFFRGFGPEPDGRPTSLPSDLIGMDSAAEIDFSARRF